MLLKIKGSQDQRIGALVNPVPTATAKVQAYQARRRAAQAAKQAQIQRLRAQAPRRAFWVPDTEKTRSEFYVMPGLDANTLGSKYGSGEQRPVWRWGLFRVPLDVADYPATYQRMRNESVALFLKAMEGQGYRLVGRIQVHEGHYPAMGLNTAGEYTVPELDKREFKVTAQFVIANPTPVVIELPAELTNPLVLHR